MLNQYLFIHRVTDTSWPVSSPSIKQWMATHHSKLNSSPVPPPAVLSPIQPHPRSLTYQCYPDKHIPWSLTQLCYHPYNHTPGPSPSSVITHTTTPSVPHTAVLSIQPHPWSLAQQCYPDNHSPGPSRSSVVQTTILPGPLPSSSITRTSTPPVPQQCYHPYNHTPCS